MANSVTRMRYCPVGPAQCATTSQDSYWVHAATIRFLARPGFLLTGTATPTDRVPARTHHATPAPALSPDAYTEAADPDQDFPQVSR